MGGKEAAAITRRPEVIEVSVNKHHLSPCPPAEKRGIKSFLPSSLIYSFSTFLVSNYYVLSTELDFGETKMNKELTVT